MTKGTPTGRLPSQPEMQFIRPAPVNPYPELVEQVRRSMPPIDYSAIEARIMAHFPDTPRRAGKLPELGMGYGKGQK